MAVCSRTVFPGREGVRTYPRRYETHLRARLGRNTNQWFAKTGDRPCQPWLIPASRRFSTSTHGDGNTTRFFAGVVGGFVDTGWVSEPGVKTCP